MKEVRVTCRNQEEFSEIIEIARKEGYRWIGGSELSGFKPTCNYPYDIIFRNYLTYTTAVKEGSYSVKEFVSDYNIDHAEAFGIRRDEYGDTSCNLDDVDNTADEETFLEAVNLLIDVVASGAYTERGSRNNQKRNQDIMWQRR